MSIRAVILLGICICVTKGSDLSAHGLTHDPYLFSKQPFDFIIAGGGTAGLTIAVRLAEKTQLNVGVVEAGDLVIPNQNPLVDTPALTGLSFADPILSWGFSTTPQAHVDGRVLIYPRGKMVGGSSGLNSMAWTRPRREEIDIWSRLGISGGWNWDGLFPYMMKAENVSLGSNAAFPGSKHPDDGFDSGVQGHGGPVQVGYNNFFTDVNAPFVQSFVNVGARLNEDAENGDNIGVFNGQHSVDDSTGNRSYAATAYFLPNQGRTNLLVLAGARVSRVTFSKTVVPLRANGVEYLVNGTTFSARAKREVIVSAGTVQTPQILELSGIGNRVLLDKLGIQTLLDVPNVGENFQDHNSAPSSFLLKDPAPITLDALSNNATFRAEQSLQYLVNHTGAFTYLPTYSYHPLQSFFTPSQVVEVVNQTKQELASRTLSPFQQLQAEIQLEWVMNGTVGQIELAIFAGGIPGLPNPIEPGKSYVSLFVFGQHLFSRGSVHINSSSPLAAPIIDPNYFDFTFDRKILSLGLDVAARVGATSPLADLIVGITNPAGNGTSAVDIDQYVIETMNTEFNCVGTAALAPMELGGVVGDDLIVYGTSNLRVVDASVIPLHMSTHLQQIVYAIAEKAAAIIGDSQLK